MSFHETKHDIFTPENYMLFSLVERSLLLWSHVKSHLSQKSTKVKWFGYLWYLYNKIRTFHIQTDGDTNVPYFSTGEGINFISLHSHVISFTYSLFIILIFYGCSTCMHSILYPWSPWTRMNLSNNLQMLPSFLTGKCWEEMM